MRGNQYCASILGLDEALLIPGKNQYCLASRGEKWSFIDIYLDLLILWVYPP